jgi:hypothetical protein
MAQEGAEKASHRMRDLRVKLLPNRNARSRRKNAWIATVAMRV